MSFWEFSYDSRGIIWLSAVSCFLVALYGTAVNKGCGPVEAIMWVASMLALIWAIWASVPPKDPPEK